MKRFLTRALTVVPLILLSHAALAGYTGPAADGTRITVEQARQQRDAQAVILRGQLVAKLGHERYRFQDASGAIEVEIDDDDLPGQSVAAHTQVELHGTVDTHRIKPTDIDVHHVIVLAPR
jgi:uncharacterized protein (TIGR00156 family)